MTLTIEITPEAGRALADKARRAGIPLPDYAVRVLAQHASDNNSSKSGSLYDFLALAHKIPPVVEEGMLHPINADVPAEGEHEQHNAA